MDVAPENTSGQDKLAIIPDEVKGWNWGAFFLAWIWGIGNNVWIALLSFIPFFGFTWAIVLGVKGNEWAWRHKKWDNIEHFKRTQRKWSIAGVVVFVVGITILIITLVAPPSTAPLPETPSSPSHGIPPTVLRINPQYWNTSHEEEALRIWEDKTFDKADEAWMGDELYELSQTASAINKEYHKTHTYIEGEFDCNDMAVELWNILQKQEIASVIVVGNLDLENESFEECNHAWLIVPYLYIPDFIVVEPTNGEVYIGEEGTQYREGYYYTSPSNLRADMWERW